MCQPLSEEVWALALTASLGFATGSVMVKHLRLENTLLAVTSWQLILGSVPLFVASAIVERPQTIIWNARFLVVLFFLALVGTAAATAVWYSLLQREDLGRLSLFLFLVPAAGLALSAAVYDEAIDPLEATGVAFIFAAVAVAIGRSWHAGSPGSFEQLPIGVAKRN